MIHLKDQVLQGGKKIPTDYILSYDLQNNFNDNSGNGFNGIPGATNNLPSFSTGRKGNDLCAVFNGVQSFKTPFAVAYNSNILSISFWIKTNDTGVKVVMESSVNMNVNNAFACILNEPQPLRLGCVSMEDNYNRRYTQDDVVNGTWKHIIIVIDRTKNGIEEIKLYVNAKLSNDVSGLLNDNNGIFASNVLFIGQRAGNSLGFVGSMQQIRIYKRVLSIDEITQLYNE